MATYLPYSNYHINIINVINAHIVILCYNSYNYINRTLKFVLIDFYYKQAGVIRYVP